MAANGRRQNRRQQPAVDPADRQQVGAGAACRTNFGGGLGEREAKRSLPQPRRAAPARQSARNLADSQTLAALIYGGQRSSPEPAAASGSRPCRPVISRRFLEIRRIREVQFMLPEFVARIRGSKWNRALPGGVFFIIAYAARFDHPLRKKLAEMLSLWGRSGRRLALRPGGVI